MTEQIPAEAVEAVRVAVGRVLVNAANFPAKVGPHILGQDMAPLIDKVTESVVAALPYQPARVVPSVEEAYAEAEGRLRDASVAIRYDDDEAADFIALSEAIATLDAYADALAALFASQPTVADVREQALVEAEALVRPPMRVYVEHGCHEVAVVNEALHHAADRIRARIARGETKGDE